MNTVRKGMSFYGDTETIIQKCERNAISEAMYYRYRNETGLEGDDLIDFILSIVKDPQKPKRRGKGTKETIRQKCEKAGISKHTFYVRRKAGATEKEALAPVVHTMCFAGHDKPLSTYPENPYAKEAREISGMPLNVLCKKVGISRRTYLNRRTSGETHEQALRSRASG